MRERTPKEIALLVALVIGALSFLIVALISKVIYNNLDVLLSSIVSLIILVSTYLLVYYILEQFIYEKIKLIYKTINEKKIDRKKDSKQLMSTDILSDVNRQVLSWAANQKQEIEELKEKETFRREFIGNLAHELKTPIFSIQGYILTLLEGALEDEKINRNFLLKASKNVERLVMLTEDLDALTKYESRNLRPEIERFSMVEIVNDIMDSLSYKADEKNIKLRFFYDYETNFQVEADKGMIAQVFTNLISNSVSYGKEGGETVIRFFDMDKHYLIEIQDNGIGISKEDLPRIFERFYRVDKSRSRHEGGSGLGLAIVKHILEVHEQNISVNSTENIGTVFSFTLLKARKK